MGLSSYILAHDLGTSGDKATLFTVDGDFVATVTTAYPKYSFPDGGVEQDPEDWWRAVCLSTKTLLVGRDPADVVVVGFDGTFPNCLCLDACDSPITRARIWQDVRAAPESDELERGVDTAWLHTFSNARIGADKTAAKLVWMSRHEPELFGCIAMVLPTSQDFIVHRLTGEFVTERNAACGTRMVDAAHYDWDEGMLELVGISRDKLPRIVGRSEVVGEILPSVAEEIGLLAGTPVVSGTGDAYAADVGIGMLDVGDAYFTGGTSGGIYGIWDDGGVARRCGGETSASGASFAWLKDTLCLAEHSVAERTSTNVYDVINDEAAAAPVGSHGVLFHPYLSGERHPRFNGMAQGSFIGISLTTTRADLVRSVIEGIGFNVSLILDGIRKKGVCPTSLPIIGGLGTSEVTRQIFADIMDVELEVPQYPAEVATMGTAIIAGIGVGLFPDERTGFEKFNRIVGVTRPNPTNVQMYEALKPIVEEIYQALEPVYPDIYATRKWLSEQS